MQMKRGCCVANWFVSLSIPAALYWLVLLIVLGLVCAAGVDYLLSQAFPEEQE